jgi:hypothetical protein
MKTRRDITEWQGRPGPASAAGCRCHFEAGNQLPGQSVKSALAFTLLEVMIAAAIFFLAMLSLLGVLSTGIHAATLLQRNYPTLDMAVAKLTLTNKLEEVPETGDFGEIYPGYRYLLSPHELLTNGLFQVDVTVYHQDRVFSSMSILLFRPDSQKKF